MKRFTFFSQFSGGGYGNVQCTAETLEQATEQATTFAEQQTPGYHYVAWMEGAWGDSHRTLAAAREEAIAAGRVIDLVDGKYIPRGTGEPHDTPPAITEGGEINPQVVDKALWELLTNVPAVTENDKRNKSMLFRDSITANSTAQRQAYARGLAEGAASLKSAKVKPSPFTLSPDRRPASHLVDPAFATAAERSL
jgi:hypothetical protein